MDQKIKKMSKEKVLYELERLTNLSKGNVMSSSKEKKKADKVPKIKPDYNIFEKPKKKKLDDYFSLEFIDELKDNIGDKKASKALMKIIKGKSESDSSSSDEE